MFNGSAEIRASHGVIDNQRHTRAVGDIGKPADIGDVAQGVANRFAIDRFGFGIDEFFEIIRSAVIGELHLDAVLREGVGKEVVGAAIQC